ncbi:22412_t:CDS:2, partial [Racocetra persica]
NDRIITRYKNLNPQIDAKILRNCLEYEPKFFTWGASDFFNVIDSNGKRQMIVVESDSSPAGQVTMPSLGINKRHNGYKFITQTAFKQALKGTDPSIGELAILYDVTSDETEATGFAAAISEETKEHVWIVMLYDIAKYELLKWENKVMYIKDQDEGHKPWIYFPLKSKTVVFNNIISCLAGGQNKIMAAKSFELFNTELSGSGLVIRFPKTVYNVNKSEIYSCIEKMGGRVVIKSPYGSCGHGVYTITNSEELKEFFDTNHHYEKFIVQSLVESAYGDSWNAFGTNVSVKLDSSWIEEYERVITVDQKEFDTTGLGIDDLIDAYVQTVLSIIAIDKMCQKLFVNHEFNFELYRTLNPDDVLLDDEPVNFLCIIKDN